MTLIDQEIDKFIQYFKDQARFIYGQQDGLYTRILWVTLLDAISSAAHPRLRKNNKERIVAFLESTAKWDIANCCSLAQIKLNLEDKKLVTGKLYSFVSGELLKWPKGNLIETDHDPDEKQLLPLAYCDCERKIIGLCRFKDLFYSYRNWLVHGFKIPGYGMDQVSNKKKPYYHSSEHRGLLTWELVFPLMFFDRLIRAGIDNLESQLKQEQRDPRAAYVFGSKW